MKRILSIALILLLLPAVSPAGMKQGPEGAGRAVSAVRQVDDLSECPAGTTCVDGEGNMSSPSLAIGTAESKADGDIVTYQEAQWLNSAGTSKYGYRIGYIVDDNTDGTEDTSVVIYRYNGGSEQVAYYMGGSLSAAPTTWSPAINCRVRSDGTGVSPWDTDQWVRWNGSAWEAD